MTDRTGPEHFFALHRHGFVRVAAATPRVRPADVAFNRDAILAEARRADAARVDLVVFPELSVSSYAIDDLHLQDALLDAVEAAIARDRRRERAPRAGAAGRRAAAPQRPALQLRARHRARPHARRRCRRATCPTTANITRSAGSPPAATSPARRSASPGTRRPFGTDLIFAADDLAGFVFHVEICEDFWARDAALDRGRAGRRDDPRQPLGLEHHHRQGRRAPPALPLAVGARVAAYVYSAAGPGESTTDLAWDGQGAIYELGDLLAEIGALPGRARALPRRRRHRPHPRRADAQRTFNDAAGQPPAVPEPLPRGSASSTGRTSRTSA